MATRKKATPPDLPALDALPQLPTDHETLHAIVNFYVSGNSQTKCAEKFGVPLAYIKGVVFHFLTRYDH